MFTNLAALEDAERVPARSRAERPALTAGAYRLRLAEGLEDLQAVFRLRFLVFNVELGEGLESAYRDGFDTDEFDSVCDHLIVEHRGSGQVVGTYRLQTGNVAGINDGYYSAREFEFVPYEPIRDSIVELGRASIHRDHRSFEVLTLLWRGIAAYAKQRNARYLIGCCSLTSCDPAAGIATYKYLDKFVVEPALRTRPHPHCAIPDLSSAATLGAAQTPRLLRAYLSIGAKICGPPAIDRDFGTIDFLTLLDLHGISGSARARFLS